jgi:hypothetical protein
MVFVALAVSPAWAQQSPQPVSVENISRGLQQAHSLTLGIAPASPVLPLPSTRLGMLTLLPPDTNGEIVKVAIPIGDLTMRLARSVSNARHQRAERKAGERVGRALREFEAQRTRP